MELGLWRCEVALTVKQEAFCLAFVETGIASEAYRRSYSAGRMKQETIHVKAAELMADGKVAVRIAELRAAATKKAVKKLEISKEWVLGQLVENVAMAKSAEPVLDNEGNPTGEYKQNLAAANKALELIGKELAMFVERKEVRNGSLDDASIEELMEIRKSLEDKKGNAVRH